MKQHALASHSSVAQRSHLAPDEESVSASWAMCRTANLLHLSSLILEKSPSMLLSSSPRLMSGKLRILPGMFHKLNSRGWDHKQWDNKSTAQKEFSVSQLYTAVTMSRGLFSPPSSILSLTFNDSLTQGSALISLEVIQVCF